MKVSRGLLAADRDRVTLRVVPGRDAARRIDLLRSSPYGAFTWKETAQMFARFARWEPDWLGQRIRSQAAQADARFVARVARRAWRGASLPTPAQWPKLCASIKRVYAELQDELGHAI